MQVALGQDAEILQVTVTQLAGDNVYLDAGSQAGIAEGDTLVVQSDASRRLLVIAASRSQSIAQFAAATFPITRGQQLSVALVKGTAGADQPQENVDAEDVADEAVADEAVSIMEQPAQPRIRERRRASSRVEVDGRLMLSFSTLRFANAYPFERCAGCISAVYDSHGECECNHSEFALRDENECAPAYRLSLSVAQSRCAFKFISGVPAESRKAASLWCRSGGALL